MRPMLLALALTLAGCASAPKPAYHEVKVATPVSCVPRDAATGPEGAEAPDVLASEPDGPTRYARLAAAYLALRAWSLTAAPILEGCRAAAKP